MENGITSKIIDATVILASLREITAINLLERISLLYKIYTTEAVKEEIDKGPSSWSSEDLFDLITVIDTDVVEINSILEWLEGRYPYLHRGELSTFLITLKLFEGENRPYYYVTDDGVMRRKVGKILKDDKFIELMGKEITSVNITGSVGLIRQLYRKHIISDEELIRVIEDLRTSTFRITDDVLMHLKRLVDEA